MSTNFYPLKVDNIIKETINTVSIELEVPEDLKDTFCYEAGQYLTIKQEVKGEELRRSYSISSAAVMGEPLKISCKMIDGGRMSTYLYRQLAVGDTLEVMPPMGSFVLDNQEAPLVLLAAGSGITPIMSILKTALKNSQQHIQLVYGNRSEEEIIFKEELRRLQNEYPNRLLVQHFLSSNGERVDYERCQSLLNGQSDSKIQYFVCGPEGMIQSTERALLDAGVNAQQINLEYFSSSDAPEAAPELSGDLNDVHIIIDDQSHQISLQAGEFILDAAEREGFDPPYSCQSGVCTTCKAKLLHGEVNMENNLGLGADEIAEGYILTCISTPKTAGVKISWDDV